MFESFYGLTANPFRMSADEQFRFVHKTYKKAWAYLNYALDKGEGFVLITGRPGTGKTTLVRDTLAELKKRGHAKTDTDPTVAAFSLIGMISRVYKWYDPKGRIGAEELAEQTIQLFFRGLEGR